MTKLAVALLACVLAASMAMAIAPLKESEFDIMFNKYVKTHKRSYTAEELPRRREAVRAFMENSRLHNAEGDKAWTMTEQGNQFADRLPHEMEAMKNKKAGLGMRLSEAAAPNRIMYEKPANFKISDLPTHVDWREKNVVTSVKNQGDCGSCWTFGTAESIESAYALKTGILFTLSEEQVVECTPNPDQCGGTGGCNGGTPQLAYERIMDMGGLSAEWTYPYTSYHGTSGQCQFNVTLTPPVVNIAGYFQVKTNDYESVMHAVATLGPLAITVDASTWSPYSSGVFNGCNQSSPVLDHSVILVGYGTDPKEGDYWIVRNSWGPAWGEFGYIRLKRSSETGCGWDDNQGEGDECRDGPIERTCGTCGVLVDCVFPIVKIRE